MVIIHPYQRSFCVFFISLAVIFYFSQLKRKTIESGNVNRKENENFSSVPDFFPARFDDFENFLFENSSLDIFNTFDLFSASFDDDNLNIMESENEESEVIYILGLFELTSGMGARLDGTTELTAAKMAVKHVNALSVLPGFKLKLVVNDTKCDPGVAIDRLFHAIYSEKRVVMLLGSGCSNVSEALAHIVPYWNIVQVSYGSKSPTLSDVKKFPYFFRTLAPDSSHDIAKIHFIKRYNWQVVATFSESENAYLLPMNHLITDLEKENISCIATVTFSVENYKEQLSVLKALDIRVIISSFSAKMAPKIFCAIFDLNMYGNEYVWILERQENNWWETTSACSRTKLKKAIEGVIMVGDYYDLYNKRFFNRMNVSMSTNAKLAYDAIWAIALTLRNSNIRFLSDFHYKNTDMACQFVNTMRRLEFVGLSGPIRFNGADRVGDFLISQIQGSRITDVSLYNSVRDILDFNCKFCKNLSWQNEQIPIAQRILKETLVTIPAWIFFAVSGISLIGIITSLTFLYFNLKFRQMKTVKLSSPNLNNIAVVGCILVYLSIMVFEFHNVDIKWKSYIAEYCSVNVYLLSAGFSLTFGSMFAKSYRVHRLFTYSSASLIRDKLLKDQHLIGLILIPLFIDSLIMSLWLAVDPLQRRLHNLMLEISLDDPKVVYQPQVGLCQCQNTTGWFIALFGYKGLILIMGAYMAWKTRNIKVQALNESQYIVICVYSCVFCAVIVIVFSLITDYFILTYIAKSLSILVSTTIVLVLLFVPKFKSIIDNVNMELSLVESMGLKLQYNTRRLISDDPKELIHRLEIQNKVYKTKLQELDKEIAYLENLLNSPHCSKQSTKNNSYIKQDYNYLEVPRASWPTWQNQTIKQFLSENKLTNVKYMEKSNIFDKLKRFFGSFASLRDSHTNLEDTVINGIKENEENDVQRSNPEISSTLLVPFNRDLTKMNSEGCVRKSY